MRTKNSIVNSLFAVFSYIILFFGPFFVIPFVKNYIGTDVLGLEKTFIDIVYFARLGTIYGVYRLYKPIAENDFEKITIFLDFYRKLLTTLSILVFVLGLCFLPLVPEIVKSVDLSKLDFSPKIIFMLYVLDVSLTYLYGHKRAIIIADQKNYITTMCRTICRLTMFLLQVLVICFLKSFAVYILVKVSTTFLESVLINLYYNKNYSHIPTKAITKMPLSEKLDFFKLLRDVMCHKFSYEALFSGSTFVMTTMLSATVTGIYYPYLQIATGLITIMAHIFNSINSSLGNYLSEKTANDVYKVYKKIYFFNFFIFSFFSVILTCLSTVFIELWVGVDSILPIETIVLIVFYFYLLGMRQSINMVKVTAGLFRPDRYLVILEPILNLFFAIYLASIFGINGILLANIITILSISFLTQPFLVYKNVFKKSRVLYYKDYLFYFTLTLLECALSYFLCKAFYGYGIIIRLFANLFICMLVPNLINCIIFRNSVEFIYFFNLLKKFYTKLILKINGKYMFFKSERDAFEKE